MKRFAYLLIALTAVACTEDISLDLGAHDSQLVIIAMFNNEPAVQKVVISKSVPYFGDDMPSTVDDAEVWVSGDDMPEEKLTYTDSSGTYNTRSDFAIAIGKTYRLRVLHNGKEYTAEDKATDNIALKNIHLSPTPADTALHPTFILSGEVWRNDISNIHVRISHRYNGKKIAERLENYAVGEVPAGSTYGTNPVLAPMLSTIGRGWFFTEDNPTDTLHYAPLDTVGIQMHTLSKTLFRYISSAKHESSGGANPMFGGVPANAEGNIQGEGAVGVFGLYISGSITNVVLPMNTRTFDYTVGGIYSNTPVDWIGHTLGGDSVCIKMIGGAAIYSYPADKAGHPYFAPIRLAAECRHFVTKKAGEERPTRFFVKNYFEFWELPENTGGDTIKWKLRLRNREESISSILMILN